MVDIEGRRTIRSLVREKANRALFRALGATPSDLETGRLLARRAEGVTETEDGPAVKVNGPEQPIRVSHAAAAFVQGELSKRKGR